MEEYFPIIVAVSVGMFVWGLAVWIAGLIKNERRKLAERLAGTSGTTGSSTPATSIVVQSETVGLSPFLANNSLIRGLNRRLHHAYPEASFYRFAGLSVGLSIFLCLIFLVLMDSPLMASGAFALGGYLPLMFVNRKRNKRQRTFAEQLPEALEFLQRILRAGHSLSTGLAMMGDELPQPLSGEFRKCYDQHSLGQPLEDCMREMATRIESTDFAFFVTAVLIQRQTGGDLSQVLGNISGMIRQRIRLQQYVKAKTAEGRFTGYILVAFPVFMFFVASGMNPEYKKNLLGTSSGLTMLGIAGALVVLGLITIRKITTVKV